MALTCGLKKICTVYFSVVNPMSNHGVQCCVPVCVADDVLAVDDGRQGLLLTYTEKPVKQMRGLLLPPPAGSSLPIRRGEGWIPEEKFQSKCKRERPFQLNL